jgi:hypothetical protein
MRRMILGLVLATSLNSCGGSSGTASLEGASLTGNSLSSTVRVERRFLYTLNQGEGTVSGFVLEESPAGHQHQHAHQHARVRPQQDLDHDHDHHDHDHPDEPGDHDHPGLAPRELDGSPYNFPWRPLDLVIDRAGETMLVLDQQGQLQRLGIHGFSGLLTPLGEQPSGVERPRLLRLSEEGDSLAVLGDSLALFAVGTGGQLTPLTVLARDTRDWTDVRLAGGVGVAATPGGAVGFSWQLLSGEVLPEVPLPGDSRAQLALTPAGVFVLNRGDRSLSQLRQDRQGRLELLGTYHLPAELGDPQTLAALAGGEDLLVGDQASATLLALHEDHLDEHGHAFLGQTASVLFAVPQTSFVLAGHAAGWGFQVLELSANGLTVHEQLQQQRAGVSAFGWAQRVVEETRVINL